MKGNNLLENLFTWKYYLLCSFEYFEYCRIYSLLQIQVQPINFIAQRNTEVQTRLHQIFIIIHQIFIIIHQVL